jgi:hypothetical protein
MRDTLTLQKTTSNNVALVTSGTNCTKARAFVDSVLSVPPSTRRVYLFKLGSNFGIYDNQSADNQLQNRQYRMWFVTSKFKYLSGSLW